MEKQSITEKVNQARKENPFSDLTLSDILWPLSTIAILLLLIIFVYVPFGLEIPTFMSENSELTADLNKRNQKLTALAGASDSEVTEVYNLLAEALPERFDVSVLASEVDTLARSKGLQENDFNLKDEPASGFSQTLEEEGEIKGLRSITGLFSFRGELSEVNSFMDTLVTASKLIVIEEFELRKIPLIDNAGVFQGEEWNLDITLKAYSFKEFSETNVEEPLSTVPPLQDVKDIINVNE